MSLYESDGWIVGRDEETLPSGTKLTRIEMSHDWREAVSESIKRGRAEAQAEREAQKRNRIALALVIIGFALALVGTL